MKKIYYILIICFCLSNTCKEKTVEPNNQLIIAIDSNDTHRIRTIIKNNPRLLNDKTFYKGNSPLVYSIIFDKFNSFKTLIELGADVNFINNEGASVLLNSIRYYKRESGLNVDLKYIKVLLDRGANPNYAINEGFTNTGGGYIMPISPICKASAVDSKIVKILVQYGADYKKPVGGITPFGFALKARKFEIIDFYIDTLKVDLNKPVSITNTKPYDSIKVYYPKDLVKKYFNFSEGSSSHKLTQKLIRKLDSLERN